MLPLWVHQRPWYRSHDPQLYRRAFLRLSRRRTGQCRLDNSQQSTSFQDHRWTYGGRDSVLSVEHFQDQRWSLLPTGLPSSPSMLTLLVNRAQGIRLLSEAIYSDPTASPTWPASRQSRLLSLMAQSKGETLHPCSIYARNTLLFSACLDSCQFFPIHTAPFVQSAPLVQPTQFVQPTFLVQGYKLDVRSPCSAHCSRFEVFSHPENTCYCIAIPRASCVTIQSD
jgi:hypothetical protein